MEYQGLAVHRTIVAVDVEGFGDRRRTNRNQVAVRDGLYRAMQEAFREAGVPWIDRDHEDRGDGMFILVGSEVPKSLFVELLPSALVAALERHNGGHPGVEQIRLRMALHAGEVNYDEHGVTAASINLAFRLLGSDPIKELLADSPSPLAIIASSWFFEEVVQHSSVDAAAYRPVVVAVKETTTTGWIYLPDFPDRSHRESTRRPQGDRAAHAVSAEERYAERVREAFSLACRSALEEPIISAGEMPVGLEIPTLGVGYVDHRFRVAEVTASSEPARESWWTEVPIADDVCHFLLTRLASPDMVRCPVVLLGQPGSGKSVLTRALAARLSTAGHLAIRVELRQVAAEKDPQDQIEFAIREATGERVRWPQFIKPDHDGLPVVIFDGFDELLQATGAAHDDFLLRVQAFQEREARLGRPVAVIVTSRIAVTDRARIPYGTMVLRLEPFSREQITAWLAIWGQTNRASFAMRRMKPLPPRMALRYQELAEQPLLLLMLALYDADANALQRRSAALGRTELYRRLLGDFARREVRKNSPAIPEIDLEPAAEAELLRLSVVAFAMFNRRSQWVLEADLDADFSALLINEAPHASGSDISPAQVAVGRFFFIRESRAVHDNRQLRTYEFLHATFGEFLVAHLVVRLLTEMITTGTSSDSLPGDGIYNGMLHSLLSFVALSSHLPTVAFIGDLMNRLEVQQRAAIANVLLLLHSQALFPVTGSAYGGYQPLALTVTIRHAAWSANLVILAVLAGKEITGIQLFPRAPNPGLAWRDEALLWRSQLTGYGWEGLDQAIALDRLWDGEHREIRLHRNDGTFAPDAHDAYWIYNIPPGDEEKGIVISQGHNSLALQRRINFSAVTTENIMAHALVPLTSSFPTTANICVVLDNGVAVSAARALLSALYAPYQEDTPDDSVYLNLARTASILTQDPNVERDNSYLKAALRILISAVEQGAATSASLQPLAGLVANTITGDNILTDLLDQLARLL